MKKSLQLMLALVFSLGGATQVFSQSSGLISYEIVRKVDPSGMRIVINGEQVKPGDPNFPNDIPDTRAFGQKVFFAGNFIKESREEQNAVIRRMDQSGGMGGPPATTNMGRPFEEQVFIDISGAKTITLLTIGKGEEARTYRAESPVMRAEGWQLTDQTKKIAGYQCRKATVPFRKENYTVWFTTDLPFTYSPIAELTPEKGVALLIESSKEQANAMKVSLTPVEPKDVEPSGHAQNVTSEQLKDIREKAMADFRQQMMMREGN